MRAVLAIAALGPRRLLRDRLGLAFTLVLPFTVILLVGLAVGGGEDERFTVAIPEIWPLSMDYANFLDALEAQPGVELSVLDDEEAVRRAARHGRAGAGVLAHPAAATAAAPGVPGVRVVASRDPEDAGAALAAVRAALIVTATGRAPDVALETVGAPGALGRLSQFGYTAAANLVLFTFITPLAASSAFIEARRLGVRRRLSASPVPATGVLAGEALSRLAIAGVQTLIVLVGASALFGVHWGDPLGVGLVALLFATVATAVGLLLGVTLRTPEQAGAIGPMAGIALGMLGGCMWPLEITGPVMRAVGHLTPHAWAVDALVALGGGAGAGAVLGEAAVLAGFAAVLLPLAVWRLARSPV